MQFDILETLQSSFVMIVLLGCSVVALTFILERWLYLKRSMVDSQQFFTQLQEAFKRGRVEAALAVCTTSLSSLASVIRAGLEESKSQNSADQLMDAATMEERMKLEKNLNVLGTLGNLAPLIGLFGTVLGIIRAFHAMALHGSGGPSVISGGIAEALVTTAAGLVVAVPAVVFYNFFVRRVNIMMTDIESVRKKFRVMVNGV
jgi:biopolymer transport protein ExbB